MLSAYETAMLNYEHLITNLAGKGMKPKNLSCYNRLKKAGHWDAQWLIEEYTKVIWKTSTLSASTRDFIEFIGDAAADIWMTAEEEVQKRLKPSDTAESE